MSTETTRESSQSRSVLTKPWVVNSLLFTALLGVVAFVPDELLGLDTMTLIRALTLALGVWAWQDARALRVQDRETTWGGLFSKPWLVFLLTFLAWIVFFPLYITYRRRVLDGLVPFKPDTKPSRLGKPPAEVPPRKHYVIAVHGTWASPTEGRVQWYQIDHADTFMSKLAERLAAGPLAGSVASGARFDFFWSGDNTHESRISGSRKLCELMLTIVRDDPGARIHIIAHSHGGNVALEAVHEFLKVHADLEQPPRAIGRLVFLGTPFLHKQWTRRAAVRELLAAPPELLGTFVMTAVDFVHDFQYLILTFAASVLLWKVYQTDELNADTWAHAYRFWEWPTPLLAILGFFFITRFVLQLFEFRQAKPIDSNIYFDVNRFTCGRNYGVARATLGLWTPPLTPSVSPEDFTQRYGKIPRQKALVITSKSFDEALLALSAAPLFVRFIKMKTHESLRPKLPAPPKLERTYEEHSGGEVFGILAAHLLRYAVWLITWPAVLVVVAILRPLHSLYARVIARILVEKAQAAGFGVPQSLLRRWSISVSPRIGVPRFLDEEVLDVSQALYQPLMSDTARAHTPLSEYRYLWDERLLRERNASNGWIRAALGAVPTDVAGDAESRLTITIEDRFRELATAIELTHGSYYNSDAVRERIAEFLEQDDGETGRPCLSDIPEDELKVRRLLPRSFFLWISVILAGLKLWGVIWLASVSWLVVMAPYFVGMAGAIVVNFLRHEKVSDYIRRAIATPTSR